MPLVAAASAPSPRVALKEAVEAVPGPDLASSLADVVRRLPLAVGIEVATIRLRDNDADGKLHLVAVEGAAPEDRVALSFHTMTIAQARAFFVLGPRHSLGRARGLRWAHGEWLKPNDEPIGAVSVGSRTERRPSKRQLAFLEATCRRLGERLSGVDRRLSTLQAISRHLVRSSALTRDDAPESVRNVLRPREVAILTLYADGLGAQEIADLFVISTHTVRTHIKNAYRRLGVHSREEAEQLMRAQRVLELV
jgi:DNA-binding CsgD family transcriptional regulator